MPTEHLARQPTQQTCQSGLLRNSLGQQQQQGYGTLAGHALLVRPRSQARLPILEGRLLPSGPEGSEAAWLRKSPPHWLAWAGTGCDSCAVGRNLCSRSALLPVRHERSGRNCGMLGSWVPGQLNDKAGLLRGLPHRCLCFRMLSRICCDEGVVVPDWAGPRSVAWRSEQGPIFRELCKWSAPLLEWQPTEAQSWASNLYPSNIINNTWI